MNDAAETGWRRHWPLLVLLLLTTLAYAHLWGVSWSWDDEALILDNQVTGTISFSSWAGFKAGMTELFTRDLWGTTRLEWLKSGYYRPLMLLSLVFDRMFYPDLRVDGAASWAHFHSLLWHLGAVSALYGLLVRLMSPMAAVLGATLFALHPLNAEVMALVAARNDSMAAFFTLTALLLLLDRDAGRGLKGAGVLAGSGLLFLCGLLSKESAVLGPVMLLALDVARHRSPLPGWRRYVPFVVAGLVYWVLRSNAEVDAGLTLSSGWGVLQENGLAVVALYGKLLVWPWPLTPARHVHYLPPASDNLLGLALFLGLCAAAVARGERRALVITGLVWAVMAFVPSLAATLDKGLLGERYLYFSLAGLGLTLAAAVGDKPPRWLIPALAIPGVGVLQLRLPQWQDSETVWEAAHEVAPSPFTAAGLAWYYHRDKDYDRALPLLVMALEGDPPYHDVCDLIIMAYIEDKQLAEGARIAKWAVEERGCPPRGMIIDHWSVALAGTDQWREAVQVALRQPGGPSGPSLTVVVAAQALQGDVPGVLKVAQQEAAKGDRDFLRRVLKLLNLSGHPDTVQQILAAIQPPPGTQQQEQRQPSPEQQDGATGQDGDGGPR